MRLIRFIRSIILRKAPHIHKTHRLIRNTQRQLRLLRIIRFIIRWEVRTRYWSTGVYVFGVDPPSVLRNLKTDTTRGLFFWGGYFLVVVYMFVAPRSSAWSISTLADAITALATRRTLHGSTSLWTRSGSRIATNPTSWHASWCDKRLVFRLQMFSQTGCTTNTLAPTRSNEFHLRAYKAHINAAQILKSYMMESSESYDNDVWSLISLSLRCIMIIMNILLIWWACGEPWKVLYGSIMHMLVHTVMPLDDPQQNLSDLWQHVKRLYKELDVRYRYSSLKMTMFSPKGASSVS